MSKVTAWPQINRAGNNKIISFVSAHIYNMFVFFVGYCILVHGTNMQLQWIKLKTLNICSLNNGLQGLCATLNLRCFLSLVKRALLNPAGDAECSTHCDWNQSIHNNGTIDHWPSFLCCFSLKLPQKWKIFQTKREAVSSLLKALICLPVTLCCEALPSLLHLSFSDLQTKTTWSQRSLSPVWDINLITNSTISTRQMVLFVLLFTPLTVWKVYCILLLTSCYVIEVQTIKFKQFCGFDRGMKSNSQGYWWHAKPTILFSSPATAVIHYHPDTKSRVFPSVWMKMHWEHKPSYELRSFTEKVWLLCKT